MRTRSAVRQRLKRLEQHLSDENPLLLQAVKHFRDLDRIARKLGRLGDDETFTARVSWWPLIAVVGVYSSGKSSFINHYLGTEVQASGNQAVDDKFTILCYSNDGVVRTLPGLALDADPRFPFYRVSHEIDQAMPGEGARIDSYLQLKTCPAQALKGRILVDSPGFDADAQRDAALRITDHILDLADLVLVFFDARHPEPGSMRDTLRHLVAEASRRADANKFLYVLNQMDATEREGTASEVFASWQRAIAQQGLSSGAFLQLYNPDIAPELELQQASGLKARRERDYALVQSRIDSVGIDRCYRVLGSLERIVDEIEGPFIARASALLRSWRRTTWTVEGILLGLLVLLTAGILQVFPALRPWGDGADLVAPVQNPLGIAIGAAGLALVAAAHIAIRRWARRRVLAKHVQAAPDPDSREAALALTRSTAFWRTMFLRQPRGWTRRTRRRLKALREAVAHSVQSLNDQFSDPSGDGPKRRTAGSAAGPGSPSPD
jgi:hypothetical protein